MNVNDLEFREVYDTYQPRILRYLVRLVGEHEAEDLTQEVFVKISQALQNFRGESQLSTWLYRIASNAAIDKMRTAAFKQIRVLGSLDEPDETDENMTWTETETPSVEQQLMRKEMHKCFERFVKNLPPNYRTVVVLNELEQLPNDEIAEILALSVDVVKIRLHRGRTRLLQELKAYCKAEEWLC